MAGPGLGFATVFIRLFVWLCTGLAHGYACEQCCVWWFQRVSDSPRLQWQRVVNLQVCAGNWTPILWKSSLCQPPACFVVLSLSPHTSVLEEPWEFSASLQVSSTHTNCTVCKAACSALLGVSMPPLSTPHRLQSELSDKCMRLLPYISLGYFHETPLFDYLETLNTRLVWIKYPECLSWWTWEGVSFEEFVMQITADRKNQHFNTNAHVPVPSSPSTWKHTIFFSHIFFFFNLNLMSLHSQIKYIGW